VDAVANHVARQIVAESGNPVFARLERVVRRHAGAGVVGLLQPVAEAVIHLRAAQASVGDRRIQPVEVVVGVFPTSVHAVVAFVQIAVRQVGNPGAVDAVSGAAGHIRARGGQAERRRAEAVPAGAGAGEREIDRGAVNKYWSEPLK